MTSIDPDNRDHPAHRGALPVFVGVAVNGVLAIIKGVAGVFGNSQALIADAVESATDVFTSLVVWSGLRLSAKPADDTHPYGHGKAEPLATLAVSVALVWAAVEISREAVHQIAVPHETPAAFTLIVLIGVIIIKEILFRRMAHIGRDVASPALLADAQHHRSDAITSFAAFIGIGIAVLGGEGWESADDWAALLAAAFIGTSAYRVGRPAVQELMDRAPEATINEEVANIARTVTGVEGIHRCFVRKMGFDYYVDLDVLVAGNLSVREGHSIAHDVQDEIRAAKPEITKVLVHVEPYDSTKG